MSVYNYHARSEGKNGRTFSFIVQTLLEVALSYIKLILCICNKGPLLIITGWGKIAVYGIMGRIMENEEG